MTQLSLFFISSITLILIPGQDSIFVLTRGLSNGKIAGAISAIGIVCGLLFHAIAASLGLAAILQTYPKATLTIKIIGGFYLIYLGIKTIKNRNDFTPLSEKDIDKGKFFIQGFISNIMNPKIILFFFAFLPQFVNESSENYRLYLIILGLIFAFITLIYMLILGIFSGSIGKKLSGNNIISIKIQIISGTILFILGIIIISSIL